LERYFGRPYPYEKLDLLAVPEFWPGAMENAGAITFRDGVLLVDPKTVGVGQLSTLSLYMAHEMAHQWFGDLVTMDWWDDLWLNEGFASWMENKTTQHFHPDWEAAIDRVASREGAMRLDSLNSTHPVILEVRTVEQANQAFDSIS